MSLNKSRLKRVQHLYPTFSHDVGRNWMECWMKILMFWKGHPAFTSNISFFVYRPFFYFQNGGVQGHSCDVLNRACRFRWWKISSIENKRMDQKEEVKRIELTLKCIMSQNGQTHFKNLAVFTARFLKYVWPFLDIMH